MKKCNQELINRMIADVVNNLANDNLVYHKRLRYCTADVYVSDNYIVLRSYNTFVACIDDKGNCYDFLRMVYGYTATSAQHIAKFYHDYNATKKYTYRDV